MWHQMSIGKVTTLRGDSLAISLSLLSLPILSCDIYIKDFAAPFSGETYVVQIIILTLSFFFTVMSGSDQLWQEASKRLAFSRSSFHSV